MYLGSKNIVKFMVPVLAGAGMLLSVSTGAQAVPESCNEFQKLVEPRASIMAEINGSSKRKTKLTPGQACTLMTRLVTIDKKLLDWMTANKDWCQVPDDQITGLKTASGQSGEFRTKACNAAAQQAKQINAAKRQAQQQQGGQSAPGAGVRLPQGAL